MSRRQLVSRVSVTGGAAWKWQAPAVPADYRRILWLMDFHGHGGVTKDLLRHYPKEMLDDWLEELAELRLIEELEADATIPVEDNRTVVINQENFLRQGKSAGAELTRTGAYLPADRASSRRAVPKAPRETEILIREDDPDKQRVA